METYLIVSTIEALDRVVILIEKLAESPEGLGLLKLSQKTGLAPSTVHRYLTALQEHNLAKQDNNKTYRLTSRLYLLGLSASEGFNLETHARDSLLRLATATRETSCLMVPEGKYSVCISQVDSHHQLKIAARVGSRQDLRVGATSRTLLAHMPTEVQHEILNQPPLEQHTKNTVTDPDEISAVLSTIRQKGYYVSTSEVDEGVIAVAAPVQDRRGEVVAALAVAAPESRLSVKETLGQVIELVTGEASRLSVKLGFSTKLEQPERETV